MIVEICSSKSSTVCSELRTSASLALAKFMLVSGDFCEDNLQVTCNQGLGPPMIFPTNLSFH